MSKTVKTVAKVVGVAALAATGIGLALGVSSVLVFGTALSLKTVATIGLLGVSIGFAGGPKPNLDLGRQMAANLSTTSSPTAVRSIIFGRALVAGQVLFRENVDNSNSEDTPDRLVMVLGLGGYPADAVEKIWLNDTLVFDGDSTTGPGAITTGKFANNLWCWFRTGHETTAAFPEISSTPGVSATWGSRTRKLRGIPALAIRLNVVEELEGRVEPLVQLRGARLYDPRLDTTAGGSGSHRIDDSATWEWSENPALAALAYLVGFRVNDKLVAGLGVSGARIDLDTFAAEASVCEESVDVKGGGSIDRYTCNGVLVPEASHRDNLRQILSSCAGSIDASDGTYQMFVGAWRSPSMDLTEGDVDQSPSEIQLEKDPATEINIIRGSFTDLAARQVLEYPERRDTDSIAKFGERSIQLDFPLTNDHRIIQRLTKIEMLRANAQRYFAANYWLRTIPLQPGDIVRQTYLRYGFDQATMRVNAWGLEPSADSAGNPKLVVAMQLVEEREDWFDWDEDTEEADLSSGDAGIMPPGSSTPRLDTLLGSVDKTRITRDVSGQNLLPAREAGEVSWSSQFSGTSPANIPIDDLGFAPGDVVSLSGEIRSATGADDVRITVQWRAANGTTQVGPSSPTETISTDTYQRVRAENIEVPADAHFIRLFGNNTNQTETAFRRRLMLNLGPVALPFEQPPTRVNRGEVEEGADVTANHAGDISFVQSTAPATPKIGWQWADTSTTPATVKRWSGSAWVVIGTLNLDADDVPESATKKWAAESGADVTAEHAGDISFVQSTAPGSPKVGWQWADTSTTPATVKRWSGSAWVVIGTLNLDADDVPESATKKWAAESGATVGAPDGTFVGSEAALTVEEATQRAIAALEASGEVKAAKVLTSSIAANAVSVVGRFLNASQAQANSGSTFVEIMSLSFTHASSSPLRIDVTFVGITTGGGFSQIRVRRSGTNVDSMGATPAIFIEAQESLHSYVFSDSPSSGSYTYTVEINQIGANTNPRNITQRTMVISEFKR